MPHRGAQPHHRRPHRGERAPHGRARLRPRSSERLHEFDRLACGFVNDSGDYIEMVCHPEGASWGLGDVIPVVGSGPGSVLLNNSPFLQRDLVHQHRFIEDMRLLEDGIRSYMLLPLNSRGRSIGVLALGLPAQRRLRRCLARAPAAPGGFRGPRLRERPALPAHARAQHHRRGHAPLQLPPLPPDPGPGAEARRPLSVGALAGVRGPRPLQAHQRPVRAPAGQPDAPGGGLSHPGGGAGDRLPGPLRGRRVHGRSCPRPTTPPPSLSRKSSAAWSRGIPSSRRRGSTPASGCR